MFINSKNTVTSDIDLSKLPPPKILKDDKSYSQILDEYKIEFIKEMKALDENFKLLDSDPACKLLEIAARRELYLRAKINDAALECLLAFAEGPNLDNLVALNGVEREIENNETDDSLRRRALLANDRYSTAGAEKAYKHHIFELSAKENLDVYDVKVYSEQPGQVNVSLLYREPEKLFVSQTLEEGNAYLDKNNHKTNILKKDIIKDYLDRDDIKPITDTIFVEDVKEFSKEIQAVVYTKRGVDTELIRMNAYRSLKELASKNYRVGLNVTLSSLYAALSVDEVYKVDLEGISDDIEVANNLVCRLEFTLGSIRVDNLE